MKELLKAFKRLGRITAALLIAGALAYAAKDPKYIVLGPLLNALAKFAREKWGIKNLPI